MTDPRARDRLGQASWLALVGLLLFCGPATDPGSWEVEYSRCWAVYLPGPRCVLWPSRRLNLWVKADPGTKVEIRAGGQDLIGNVEEVKGGRLYRLSIPSQARLVTVSVSLPDGSRGPSWSLQLAEPEEPAWVPEIDQLASSGKREEVRKRLAQLRRAAPRKEQGLVLRSLAYLAGTDDNAEQQASYLRQGIAADRAESCLSGEVEKTVRLARLYLDQGRFGDARQTLDAVTNRLPEAPAEAKYLVAFLQGWLADRVGDYRLALSQLRKAADLAEQIGRSDLRWKAEQVLANLLQALGRSQDASELLARLREDPQPESPCDMGDLLTNWAWSRLLAREGGEETEDPTPILMEAQAVYAGNPLCAGPVQRLNTLLNLALAHQQAGRWREARKVLEQAAPLASQANLSQLLWQDDLEARTAIAEGNPALALRLYEELEEAAERAFSFEGRFRAAFGRAQAQLALRRPAAALAALEKADALIDEQIRHVPAHEGRDTLVGQREAATRLLLSLLLDHGQQQRAFALVRHARSRLLRQLMVRERLAQLTPREQQRWEKALASYRALRDDIDQEAAREWELPGDQVERARESRAAQLARAQEDLDRAVAGLGNPVDRGESDLSPPRPGEVVLAFHPLPAGWAGFAADERGIEVSTFELPVDLTDNPALSRVLLEPFRPVLERAGRVRVLPYGRLRSVDFHTLPLGGEPLLARRSVVYSLDLPARPASAPADRRVALLVADPGGNLQAARQEATAVDAAVRAWRPGWTLERLDGKAARAEAVRAALPGADLFHYAGHGTFAGFAGWDSVLELADGSHLTPGDLLALRQAPAWVVLSSCEGSRSSEQAPGEGIGLAHAFLLAGSQAVIAATRQVPDRIARDLLSEFYRGWQPGVDLPRQLQRAQQVCLQRYPAAGCESFRLLEP